MQQQTVAKIEDGTQRLPLQDAGVIAWALGTPLLDLCGLPVQTSLSDDELRRLAREYEDQLRVLAGTVTLLEGGLVRETENLEDARAQLAKATARMRETERCLP